MKALILVGGLGTRLKTVVSDRPKPMALVLGKPFLEHVILNLKNQGITEIILAVGHLSDQIKSHFGDGRFIGVNITYSDEEVPLGTAGAIKKAEKYIDDTFIAINGDTFSNINIKNLLEVHKSNNSAFTMAVTMSKEAINYGGVILDQNKITGFSEKGMDGEALINAGVYVIEPHILNYISANRKISIENEIFPEIIKREPMYAYKHEGYFTDIGRPETYQKFKQDLLSRIFLNKTHKIRDAMEKIDKTRVDMILVVEENNKLLGVLNDRIIKKHLLAGGSVNDDIINAMVSVDKMDNIARVGDSVEKINEILMYTTNRLPILDEQGRIVDLKFRTEKMKREIYPILRGKAPLRISFAGGITDLPYFFEKYGGAVISTTIDKYCHATITKRADSKIIINSDLNEPLVTSLNNLNYDGKYDLIKAIINIAKPNFGFELDLYNDLPPGRGLGSSASLTVLIIKLLSHLQNIKYDDEKIAEMAYRVEREELHIKGGWQDQYASIVGGFNFMEFGKQKKIIYPLRLKEETINEFANHLLLCYIGKTHFSGEQHQDQEENFKRYEEEMTEKLTQIKNTAIEIKDCLLTNNLEKIGELLNEGWRQKKEISKTISNPKIDMLYKIGLENGALGGKLLGAGGGGYILFFVPPTKRIRLKRILEDFGGEIMNFNFESKGTHIWSVNQ